MEDSLSEVTYNASLAGLNYSVANHKTGLQVSFAGYNDKLSLLVNTVIVALASFAIEESRLKVMIEKVRTTRITYLLRHHRSHCCYELDRTYRNYYMGQPSNLAIDFTADLLTPTQWSAEQKRAELQCLWAFISSLNTTQYLSQI